MIQDRINYLDCSDMFPVFGNPYVGILFPENTEHKSDIMKKKFEKFLGVKFNKMLACISKKNL